MLNTSSGRVCNVTVNDRRIYSKKVDGTFLDEKKSLK